MGNVSDTSFYWEPDYTCKWCGLGFSPSTTRDRTSAGKHKLRHMATRGKRGNELKVPTRESLNPKP